MSNYYDDKYGFNLQKWVAINSCRTGGNAMIHKGLCKNKTLRTATEILLYPDITIATAYFKKSFGKHLDMCELCFPKDKTTKERIIIDEQHERIINEVNNYNNKIKGSDS